ncbi:hypothetical protein DSECCO2_558310 [anaerobic digester metagenome]
MADSNFSQDFQGGVIQDFLSFKVDYSAVAVACEFAHADIRDHNKPVSKFGFDSPNSFLNHVVFPAGSAALGIFECRDSEKDHCRNPEVCNLFCLFCNLRKGKIVYSRHGRDLNRGINILIHKNGHNQVVHG